MSKVIEMHDYAPHAYFQDHVTGNVHVIPVGLIANMAKGMDISHLSCDEKDLFIRLLAGALKDYME